MAPVRIDHTHKRLGDRWPGRRGKPPATPLEGGARDRTPRPTGGRWKPAGLRSKGHGGHLVVDDRLGVGDMTELFDAIEDHAEVSPPRTEPATSR
jgi:hypothetical protein